MRQFQVPQFITIEDKPLDPFTFKQFLYLAGAGLLIVGTRIFLYHILFWPISILVAAFAGAAAFLKINGQPFPIILKNAFLYFIKPRLYVWKQGVAPPKKSAAELRAKKDTMIKGIPTILESKLTDLAWSLDVKEKGKE